MGMSDFFADNLRENPIGVKCLLLSLGHFTNYFKIFSNIGHIPHPAIVLSRYHKRVSGRTRVDRQKSYKVLILVNFMSRNFSDNYLTENAIMVSHIDNQYVFESTRRPSWSKSSMTSYSLAHISHPLPRKIRHVRPEKLESLRW